MDEYEKLTMIAAQVLDRYERQFCATDERLKQQRAECRKAERDAHAYRSGSPGLQSIGEAIATQLSALEETYRETGDEHSLQKRRLTRLCRAVDVLREGMEGAKTPNAALVTPIVERLLSDSTSISHESLYAQVRDQLGEQGIAPIGLGILIPPVLRALSVESDSSGVYRLSEPPAQVTLRRVEAG